MVADKTILTPKLLFSDCGRKIRLVFDQEASESKLLVSKQNLNLLIKVNEYAFFKRGCILNNYGISKISKIRSKISLLLDETFNWLLFYLLVLGW